MAKYVMALDAGTTSNRCILFDAARANVFRRSEGIHPVFPQPGWVEHDAIEICTTVLRLPSGLWRTSGDRRRHCRHRHHQPAGDHHRLGQENRRAGVPRHRLAVPPHQCVLRRAEGKKDWWRGIPGARPVWSSTPIFRHQAALDSGERAGRPGAGGQGELLFGTVETWLIWKLTGGKAHVTDYSNASRTMLFNINTLRWDDEILARLDIPKCMLPRSSPQLHSTARRWPSTSVRPSPSPGRRETSRRRCSARPASSPGGQKTPTAPAVSC